MNSTSALQSMVLTEVTSTRDETAFLEMPGNIYRSDSNYIRPLDKEIMDIFDPMVNPLFKTGACKRWLLWTEDGLCIGRIAAFYKIRMEGMHIRHVGGLGFFECIDDQMAANLLIDQTKYWLEEMGVKVIHGPVNFGNRQCWWGLYVNGEGKPNYCANYHPAYYRRLIENYGFEVNYRQFTFKFEQFEPPNCFFKAIKNHFMQDDRYEFKSADPAKWLDNAAKFQSLFNKTWATEEKQSPLSLDQVLNYMDRLRDVLDWRLIWFAYFEGEPIAFFVGIPELNHQILQHINGKIKFIDKFKLARKRWINAYDKANGLYYGVLDAFKRKNVGLGLIAAMLDAWKNELKIPYRSIECGWVGDYNPKMIKVMKKAGGEISKTHQTYRYWL